MKRALGALVLTTLFAAPTLAQGVEDLARENAALRERMQKLEKRLQRMERQLRQQAKQLRALSQPGAEKAAQAKKAKGKKKKTGKANRKEIARQQLLEAWQERRGRDPLARELGALIEWLGPRANFGELRQLHQQAERRLGPDHAATRAFADGVEQLSGELRPDNVQPLLETWLRVRPHLEQAHQALRGGGAPSQQREGGDVRRYRNLKRQLVEARQAKGKKDPQVQRLKAEAEASLAAIRVRGERALSREHADGLFELEREAVVRQEAFAQRAAAEERQLAASQRAIQEAAEKHGAESVDVQRLRKRHEHLQQHLNVSRARAAAELKTWRSNAERELAARLQRGHRELQQQVDRLAKWEPGKQGKQGKKGKKAEKAEKAEKAPSPPPTSRPTEGKLF